jgi:hypothetical protein
MAIKTKEYLAKIRSKTGLSDYKIAQTYDINQSNLRQITFVGSDVMRSYR